MNIFRGHTLPCHQSEYQRGNECCPKCLPGKIQLNIEGYFTLVVPYGVFSSTARCRHCVHISGVSLTPMVGAVYVHQWNVFVLGGMKLNCCFSLQQEVELKQIAQSSGVLPVCPALREPSWISLQDGHNVCPVQSVMQVEFCSYFLVISRNLWLRFKGSK